MKAVLVIDMPSACDECKFETEMLNCGKPMCVATPYRRERIGDGKSVLLEVAAEIFKC